MNQNNIFASDNEISSPCSNDVVNENNNIVINEIQDDIIAVNNNDGWANFDTNPNSETVPITKLSISDDDWADFESNTIESKEINNDDDTFGDYGEVQISSNSQISSLPINSLTNEQIQSLISSCFPLESSTLSKDIDNFIPFELPSFITFKDQTKQLPCFEHSRSLWNILSNISNDPIGIQHQWRKSNIEHVFHQALDVHERKNTKTNSSISDSKTIISNVNNKNKLLPQIVDPHCNWKENDLANPLTNINSSSNKNDNNGLNINKKLDLDYDIPSKQTSVSNKEEHISSSAIIHRTNSPIHQNSIPIKTIDLFPGSTTVLNDDAKTVIDSVSNFSFMNPKALMFSTPLNNESTILY